jgi:L-fuculose-phosphate aldolase
MDHYALRLTLIEICMRMRELDASAFNGHHVSVSARCTSGMLITPAGLMLSTLKPEDLCTISLAGDASGRNLPSSEWLTHRDIYVNRSDINALIQCQPVHASALACISKGIPSFHYMVSLAGGKDIRCTPYATYGTQRLADYIVHAIRERKACLIAQHGLMIAGENLSSALELGKQIEHLAQMYWLASRAGEPPLLPDDEMKRVSVKFATGGTLKPGAY